MTTVHLSQYTITLDPPQRLLMIEVSSEEWGFCLRIAPAGSVEVKNLRLISNTLASPAATWPVGGTPVDALDSMAMIGRLSEAFPQLTEIDVRNVPLEYDIAFGKMTSPFRFESGQRYRISGVGEYVWEATAVAE